MKIIYLLIFIAAICCFCGGCHRTPPPQTAPVGRFELRIVDEQAVVFDTESGRIYVLETNHQFIVRDPVWETERPGHPSTNHNLPHFTFEEAKPHQTSTNSTETQ